MKHTLIKGVFLLLFAHIGMNVKSQNLVGSEGFFCASWEIALPSGNDFISEESLGGWRVEYRKMIKPNISVGLAISGNSFDEYVQSKTYSNEGNAVTTDMVRQTYTLPMTLIGHYYFNTDSKRFIPYIGVGIGAQYAEQSAYYNIYLSEETNWGFVARPEIGTFINFNSAVRGMFTVGYNLATNKNETWGMSNLNQITFNIGLAIGD